MRLLRPGLSVSVGLLDHGPPFVPDVAAGTVAVPVLLSSGYHVHVDLPAQAPQAVVTTAVGPDPLLCVALADRLAAAGYDGSAPVVLAAAGSADERSRSDVARQAEMLAEHLDVDVSVAYVASGEPRLADVKPAVVASYLLAPGTFHDAVVGCGAGVVSAPIGAHEVVAEIVLRRYDATRAP